MTKVKAFMVLFLTLVLVKFSFAQEKVDLESLKESLKQSIKKDLEENIKNALGFSVYLQAGYTYKLGNSQSQNIDLRPFDTAGNSINLDLAQLSFSKEASKDSVGYKVKTSMGETAKYIHSNGLGTNEFFDLTEAYVDYVADLGSGLKIRVGKFATFIGAEVIEAIDNPNFSRSLLFYYAIPFTHTGVMLGYPLSDKFNLNFYIVNGWDNTEDNNKSKTLGLSASYNPSETFSLTTNFIYGPEQPTNNRDNRFLVDLISTIKPMKNLSILLNADYGIEENIGLNGGDADWKGISAILKYEFNDNISLALRGEYFKDTDGVRTGVSQSVKEFTITPEFKLKSGLIVRPEYRHDWSSQNVFSSEKNQDTVAISFMYRW